MHGLNDPRLLRIVAERRANLADRDLEHGVANEDARPDGVEQVVLRDQAAAVLGEAAQQRKGLGRERDLFAAAPDTLIRAIELEDDRTRARGGGNRACGRTVGSGGRGDAAQPGSWRERRERGEGNRGGHAALSHGTQRGAEVH